MANDYTAAVNYLNQADDLGDMLLKTILQALADDNVDVMEYVMIGINGDRLPWPPIRFFGRFRSRTARKFWKSC